MAMNWAKITLGYPVTSVASVEKPNVKNPSTCDCSTYLYSYGGGSTYTDSESVRRRESVRDCTRDFDLDVDNR